jgi:Flp pilus assembly pilin Flp
MDVLKNLWMDDSGQDIAEYAVMLAVILVIVVGTIRLIGTQANNVFSETAAPLAGRRRRAGLDPIGRLRRIAVGRTM